MKGGKMAKYDISSLKDIRISNVVNEIEEQKCNFFYDGLIITDDFGLKKILSGAPEII